ncbi:MAG TPA: hypothetical protein VJT71_06215 [Pyrinomonadaceae bacterium]|nr:hypothetical protein [Pyrinomonadaceae bacterium]
MQVLQSTKLRPRHAMSDVPGSARASRVRFGALAETILDLRSGKVRDDEGVIARSPRRALPGFSEDANPAYGRDKSVLRVTLAGCETGGD